MPRLKLTDEFWSKLKPILLDAGIYDKPNLRMTFEGMLYRIRVGCQWRELPSDFGNWNSVFKRFNDWPPLMKSKKRKKFGISKIKHVRQLRCKSPTGLLSWMLPI